MKSPNSRPVRWARTRSAAAAVAEEEAPDERVFPDRPDLVLIDGGLGQLSVAREVLARFGLHDIALIGVAKGPDRDAGREHFHVPGQERPIMLEAKDPVLYFVQRLRDEAHRFAIGTHRAKRAKALGVNPLDEIEGIGPDAAAGAAHALRIGESRIARGHRGFEGSRWHFGRHGEENLRFLPRAFAVEPRMRAKDAGH